MKKTIIFFLFYLVSYSQNNKFKGLIYYNQEESIYSGKGSNPERLSILVFDKNSSIYVTSKDSLDIASQNTSLGASLKLNKDATGGSITTSYNNTRDGLQVYTNLLKDSVWSCSRAGSYYYTKEPKSDIKWFFEKESKVIGNMQCKKATSFFRGRKYIAWYTLDIPLPFGPWKLQGLPGLILEAYDESQVIYYHFKSIEFPTKNITPIKEVVLKINGKNKKPRWLTVKETLIVYQNFLNLCYESLIVNMPGQQIRKDELYHKYQEIEE